MRSLQVWTMPRGYGNPAAVRRASSNLRKILATNVREYRRKHGLSQEGLADQCELHRTYIGSIERCERNGTLSTLEILPDALHVSVPDCPRGPEPQFYLRGGDPSPQEP